MKGYYYESVSKVQRESLRRMWPLSMQPGAKAYLELKLKMRSDWVVG